MFCTNCGTELPDTANFCSNCGLQLKEDVRRKNETRVQWEYCEITYETAETGGLFSRPRTERFWAKAVGPNGVHRAGQSVSTWQASETIPSMGFNPAIDNDVRRAFYEILAELLKDGWEPYGVIHYPWQYQFKRPVIP